MTGSFELPGGLQCELIAPHMPGVPNYHVLAVDGPVEGNQLGELARLAAGLAEVLGLETIGDANAFTIILNGASASRRPWAHAHSIPVRTPAEKRRAFAFLCLKGPFRALERRLRRSRSALPDSRFATELSTQRSQG